MANKDTISRTVSVALVLCVVCSVVVSTAAVMLRPSQVINKKNDIRSSILTAAEMRAEDKSTAELFEDVETRIVDLETGKFSDAVDIETFDQIASAKISSLSEPLPDDEDIAGLNRLEKYAKVYLVRENGQLQKVVLPIRGYGLWSTLKGFIALEADLNTVVGLTFYDHKETPGLGGEVDNPRWKALWDGKKVYDAKGNVGLSVIKGNVTATTPDAEYKIDGLSGATLTSNGVDNMIEFWLGDGGFRPFLANLKKGEA